MTWTVEIHPSAAKQLANLDKPVRKRVAATIDKLAEDPRPLGSRTVVTEGCMRVRVGDYRIKYDVDDGRVVVTVIEVVHRSKAY